MTAARAWPADRAREWEMRKAADLLSSGLRSEASALANDAISESGAWTLEQAFRCLLMEALSWDDEDIDRAVAEVYGEVLVSAPDQARQGLSTLVCWRDQEPCPYVCEGQVSGRCKPWPGINAPAPSTPRPAEEIAREIVPDPYYDDEGNVWVIIFHDDAGYMPIDADKIKAIADGDRDEMRGILTRLIERSRAEGAAAERARVEELERALRSAECALDQVVHAGTRPGEPLGECLMHAAVATMRGVVEERDALTGRVAELEALVRSTRDALCLAGEAFERDDHGAVIHLLFEAEQALLKDRATEGQPR